jgi:hypothetical protein
VGGVEDSVGDEVNKATVAHRAELAGAGAPGEGGAAGATSLAPHGERGRIDWLQPGPFSHLSPHFVLHLWYTAMCLLLLLRYRSLCENEMGMLRLVHCFHRMLQYLHTPLAFPRPSASRASFSEMCTLFSSDLCLCHCTSHTGQHHENHSTPHILFEIQVDQGYGVHRDLFLHMAVMRLHRRVVPACNTQPYEWAIVKIARACFRTYDGCAITNARASQRRDHGWSQEQLHFLSVSPYISYALLSC